MSGSKFSKNLKLQPWQNENIKNVFTNATKRDYETRKGRVKKQETCYMKIFEEVSVANHY